MTLAHIGLGGNLGDPRRQMAEALRAVDAEPGYRIVTVSPLYRTPPWGKTDQPDFLNACASIETAFDPSRLLRLCLDVEHRLHRERGERWGPRTIDIDILDFGGQVAKLDHLTLPHPRMMERAFVLVPLTDIAPRLVIRERDVTVWLSDLDRQGIEIETADPDWWRT